MSPFSTLIYSRCGRRRSSPSASERPYPTRLPWWSLLSRHLLSYAPVPFQRGRSALPMETTSAREMKRRFVLSGAVQEGCDQHAMPRAAPMPLVLHHLGQLPRTSLQTTHQLVHLVRFRRAQPLLCASGPDARQPLGRPRAGAGAAVHATAPIRHRGGLAEDLTPRSSTTSCRGLRQDQPTLPQRQRAHGVLRRFWVHSPLPSRLDIADNGLTTLVHHHPLDPNNLRTFAALPIQRIQHVGHRAHQVRAVFSQL